uniref:Transmembrane protein n=1 Tax=Psilocybe cubensis TaxID=181762 RepID=A0A8H8CH53_PSICU
MDNNIVAQETPLLSENNEITAKKDSEVQIGDSDSGACGFSRLSDPLSHRSTYTRIAFIAQFFHLALACIVFGLSLVYRDEIKVLYKEFMSGWFSLWALTIVKSLNSKSSSQKNKDGDTPTTAITHYICATFLNCIFLLIISSVKLFAFNGPVQGIIIPLEIGFLAVAAVSCMATARIIRISAIQVRGTNRVHDPNHLVPAWHLATLEESQSCRRRKNRQLQLA